ncbi:hypothetical protein MHO82_22790 [Vibrio sp. Of7-15]|uniref:hypothetical protein n=1 Tax=Vibrio sp. Of7-15 TaxID=2724879 RepID=UPI001EF35092|nr:hypothetical protein [Vibrio sp. Of7-15]MCG7499696.1 hypothetical protein [Vibrio sp. Of7-15]
MFDWFKASGLATLEKLYFPNEKIDWPEPWWYLDSNIEIRAGIQRELNSEIGPKHPLWGLKPVVIGKSDANDDVIVHLNNGKFACVHLIWHGRIDQHPDKYPSSIIFENISDLQHFINIEAAEYS